MADTRSRGTDLVWNVEHADWPKNTPEERELFGEGPTKLVPQFERAELVGVLDDDG